MTQVSEKHAPSTCAGGNAAKGWQRRKSAEMRALILETAIDCLVDQGYSGFSAQHLAKRAGISRGALLHHFPTTGDLVSAVIDHTFRMRIQTFLAELRRGNGQVGAAVGMYWDNLQTREFAAWLELVVAARTDSELRAHLLPEAQRFDSIWLSEMTKAFPQWNGNLDMLQLSNDFVAVTHFGLLLQTGWDRARIAGVLALVERMIAKLHETYAREAEKVA